MTGTELIKEIEALGFDSSIESYERLYSVITISARILASEFPSTAFHTAEIPPSSDRVTVYLTDIADAYAFARNPITKDGIRYGDYSYNGNNITVYGKEGDSFLVGYTKKIAPLSAKTADNEIAIDPRATHLLPLLCSAYLWQDDEQDKAYLYLSEYKNEYAKLKMQGERNFGNSYKSSNNW
ncbi:MAG: hypothetical protein SOZ62_02630 [Eubacteriales bacterium]|nr:hypothetical protein [Eubacteriales bacterium]